LSQETDLRLVFVETGFFRSGRHVNPRLAAALDQCGIEPVWNPPVISAATVVFHNPSSLKFDSAFASRLNCQRLVTVAHENFLRPDGTPAFDVEKALKLLADRSVCTERLIAPVSALNRETVRDWLAQHADCGWDLAPIDWFNICDFETVAPTSSPRDRRGRVSRPGFDKFPDMSAMLSHFPPHAERCAILGADSFLLPGASPPPHWDLHPFGSRDVADFLATIDFFIYFTHPALRESFGRVLAEAVAAGKVVITDPETARTFGRAVVASDGTDVDRIVAEFVAAPDRYVRFVTAAQDSLAAFSAEAFRHSIGAFLRNLDRPGKAA
jgi:hypothetical protein